MTIGAFFNQWWNFPFLVMLGVALIYFVMQLVGLAGHHGKEVDKEVDHDHDHDADGHHDALADILSFFGIGRVPFAVVWLTLFTFTGLSGLFLNWLYASRVGKYPGWFFIVSLISALVVGLIAVRIFAQAAGKLVDTGGKGAVGKHELAGKLGVVASPRLDDKHGEVRVVDGAGNEQIVHGRLEKGARSLSQGTRVILVDYDAASELFWITESPDREAAEG